MGMVLPMLVFVAAQGTAPMPRTSLVSQLRAVAPGKPFYVAVHMELPSGWHNYYANPGESGMATSIAWTLPRGFKAGPIIWPLPKRETVAGITNFVYEGDLWLLTRITPPKKAALGPCKIGAKVEWLLCQDICVAQSAKLSLSLRSTRRPEIDPAGNRQIAKAVALDPSQGAPFPVLARISSKTLILTVKNSMQDPVEATFLPADADSFSVDMPKVTYDAGTLTIRYPLSKYATTAPARVSGILSFPIWSKSYWIDVPVS